MTREEIRAALTDTVALTCTLYGEASGEPVEGQIAVACVIRNRVHLDLGNDAKPDWWGEGYRGVCLAKWQFSCWWETSPNSDRVYALAEQLLTRTLAMNVSVISQLRWVTEGIVGGAILDRTKRADHYLTTALLRSGQAPPWSKASPVCVVGAHTFFRLY